MVLIKPLNVVALLLALAACGGKGDESPKRDAYTPRDIAEALVRALREGDARLFLDLGFDTESSRRASEASMRKARQTIEESLRALQDFHVEDASRSEELDAAGAFSLQLRVHPRQAEGNAPGRLFRVEGRVDDNGRRYLVPRTLASLLRDATRVGRPQDSIRLEDAKRIGSILASVVEMFRRERGGALPRDIDQLLEQGRGGEPFISAIPVDPWGGSYRIVASGKAFEIWSAGPDRTPDTSDDVRVHPN